MLLHIIIVRKCRTRIVGRVDIDALHLAGVAGSNEGFESKEIVSVYEEITSIRVSVTILGVLYQDAWLEDILFAFAYPREFESLLRIFILFLSYFLLYHSVYH